MSPLGAFSFVLHTHIPYVRLAGQRPCGEEWIHEATTKTYIPPLLKVFLELRDGAILYSLAISISPMLAEQLAVRDVLLHQSSDWPFPIIRQAYECANQQFGRHLTRIIRLVDSLNGKSDVAHALECCELDRIFPEIDFRWFRYAEDFQ